MIKTLTRLDPLEQSDPRLEIEPQALALAKRNAFPVVAQRTVRKDGMGLAAGAAGALLLGGITFWSMSGTRTVEEPKVPAVSQPATPQLPATEAPPPVAIPPEAMTEIPAGAPVATPVPTEEIAVVPESLQNPAPNRQGAPALVVDMSGPGAGSPLAGAAAGGALAGLSGEEAFAARVGAAGPEVASATRMANPGHTISQGTLIPAVLETAINTDVPGYVRAVVSSDIRSFDGRRVLVPRSSRLIGQYKSGVAGGQTRAYVLWTRLIRPDGVSVQLASPAVDADGQTGLAGQVNGHFMKRFGSALLLSVVGAASTIASGGASLILSGGESAAAVAAKRDGQIAPTIKVPLGQPIRVFTAKDLDFSTVAGTAG